MQKNSRVFTEEEFARLLETGKAPDWCPDVGIVSTPKKLRGRRGSHNDPIDLDHLTKEMVVRMIRGLFGNKPASKRRQAEIVHALLECAAIQGLVIERESNGLGRSFISTDRLLKYWPRIFGGETAPSARPAGLL